MKILLLICIVLLHCSIQFVNAGQNLRISFAPFQNLTNQFLLTVQPNGTILNVTANLIINATKGVPMSNDYNYYINLFWQPYVGYIILLIIGILFLVFFTLVGCCFCCCRVCCKKCGANMKNVSTYNMKKKRIVFNVFLFLLTTLILIGAIVAMASNFILLETTASLNTTTDQDGNIFYNIQSSVSILNDYLNTTRQNLMGPGLTVISSLFSNALSYFSPVITKFITVFSASIDFDGLKINAFNFSSIYQSTQNSCVFLSNISKSHQDQTTPFITNLNNTKQTFDSNLTNDTCKNITNSCNNIRNLLNGFTIGFNQSNINYTFDTNSANTINQYNITNLQSAVDQVTSTITNILNDANSTFTKQINSFISNLNITNLLSNLNNTIDSFINSAINSFNQYQNQIFSLSINGTPLSNGGIYTYMLYVFYGFCALISIILLVVLLFYIGLCFGVCGAPNFEDASKCNKGTGSGFLMASVAISFIFGFLIMFITMIMFFAGGVATTEFCRYFSTPSTDQIKIVDSIINNFNLSNSLNFFSLQIPQLNLYQSIKIGCSNTSDLISAFQIPSSFINNVTSFLYSNFIESQLNQTINNIGNFSMSQINTSSLDANISQIQNIVNQLMNATSPSERNELNKSVIVLNMANFQSTLQTLLSDLNKDNNVDLANLLNRTAIDFQKNVTQMQIIQTQFYQVKTAFDTIVPSLNVSLTNLNNSIVTVKQQPNNARNQAIKSTQDELKKIVTGLINSTLYGVINATGSCKGASNFFDKAINTICIVFLGPFNNIWMGMGWFLLFIIPAIIFAVKLNGIYRISHIETESAAYNHAYMASNQYLSKNDIQMIKMGRPQKA